MGISFTRKSSASYNGRIYKGNYSVALIKTRINYIMENYDLTNKQVKNIDPLVFATLHDYDECMWLEKKMTSNKAEIYVRCMSEKIEKELNVSRNEKSGTIRSRH